MSNMIAYISGKGGSGKTTLALSMADLLSRCMVKTLLIDCDLSTNGATYFFESDLANRGATPKSSILSFSDLLETYDTSSVLTPIHISNYFDFFPSIAEITGATSRTVNAALLHRGDLSSKLRQYLEKAKQIYDVILFDCQAGYTELLPALLPMMDVDIFVLETDAISASAMRNLHLKIGNHFGHAKLYQVFNKASEDEFEYYSKIVGTFFTNIGTLLFDWKIRQAFSRSQIPDLENASAKYGKDLCDICQIAITDKDIQDSLNTFSLQLNYSRLKEERAQTEAKLDELSKHSRLSSKGIIIPLYSSMTIIGFLGALVFIFKEMLPVTYKSTYYILLVFAICLTAMTILISSSSIMDSLHSDRRIRRIYQRKLKELDDTINRLDYDDSNESKRWSSYSNE